MKLKQHPALMALTTVIVIGSMALLIVIFIVLAGVDLLDQGLHDTRFEQTFAGSDGCAEEALLEVATSPVYSGGSFVVGDVDCTVVVTGSGNQRAIYVSASHGSGYTANLEVHVDRSPPPMTITDWDKVAN